jgi:hypothetical protein
LSRSWAGFSIDWFYGSIVDVYKLNSTMNLYKYYLSKWKNGFIITKNTLTVRRRHRYCLFFVVQFFETP